MAFAAKSRAKLIEKKLTEEDIESGSLVLETDSLTHLARLGSKHIGHVDFCAIDDDQRVWSFRCFTGYGYGGLVVKPLILGGWDEFVRHHGLRVKDKVSFNDNLEEGNGVPFVIRVRRTIRLFGVDITEAD